MNVFALLGGISYLVTSLWLTSVITRQAGSMGFRLSRGHRLALYVLSPLNMALIVIGDALLGEKE